MRRAGWRSFTLLFLVVLVVVSGWIGVRTLLARGHLEAARSSLAAVPSALVDRRLDDARARIDEASRETSRARALTGDPLYRLAAAVPRLGNSLSTVRGLTVAADDLSREVLPAALPAAERIDPDTLRAEDGTVDLAMLRDATPHVVASAAAAEDVLGRLGSLPEEAVVEPVREAQQELTVRADEVGRLLGGAADALEMAPALLGEDRPRRYFVMVQQAAESRGTGGLLGGFAVLEAAGGRLQSVAEGGNVDLMQGPVPPAPGTPDDFVRRYQPLGSFDDLRQTNLSPDLPVVARQVAERWRAQSGQTIDAVIALDAVAIAAILAGDEPLEVSPGRLVDPSELVDYLSYGQYVGLSGSPQLQRDRKDGLADLAGVALDRLTGGGGGTAVLLRGLADAVGSGHLRMTSDDPVLAPVLTRTEVDGALPSVDRPAAYLVLNNSTGGKLDQFLERSLTYELGECRGDRRSTVVTARLVSRPPEEVPPYVALRRVDDAWTQSRDNQVGASVYGTAGARLVSATLDGEPVSPLVGETPLRLDLGEEGGLPVWQVYVELPPGVERVLRLELDEPALPGVPQVPDQPLLSPLSVDVMHTDGPLGLRSLPACAD
jgi:hypothetical protein